MDDDYEAMEKALIPLLTEDFLATLAEAVQVFGWTFDFIETSSFVRECFRQAEREKPDLQVYEAEDCRRVCEKLINMRKTQ